MPALRLSGTAAFGTPPKKSSALTCAPIQSGSVSLQRALGVGVARRAEYRDEEVRLVHLARHRIDDRRPATSPVDKQLIARHVRLPHRRREAPSPFAVKLA